MKFVIKKEIKKTKIPTSMRLKEETITKLEKVSKLTGVSSSSIIDQIVYQGEFEVLENE